jgi:hypothetical protein
LITLFLGLSAIILSWRQESRIFLAIASVGVLLAIGLAFGARRARRRSDPTPPLESSPAPPLPPDPINPPP